MSKVHHIPHVSAEKSPTEFSIKATILGMLLALLFAVGNAYLALRVGMTISASIPAAVISMAILRSCWKKVTILENNIVQTMSSVGEGLAAGVVFTIPALFLLDAGPSMFKIFQLSMLGGILGILFMIPIRRYVIVEEHHRLPFPEGLACAEILKAGEEGLGGAKLALWSIIAGATYKLFTNVFFLWNEIASFTLRFYQRTLFSMDCTPALLGVGFIIGPRVAATVFVGGAIGWWVIIPLISLFGQSQTPIFPGTVPVYSMDANDLWSNYVRYIGAGAVAAGGLLTLFKMCPVLVKTVHQGAKELKTIFHPPKKVIRTDKDIPLSYLFLGSLAIVLYLWLYPPFHLNLITILLVTILGFFFVAVTSITVGLVGSSSNPVSGMAITTLLLTCLIFLGLGWTERVYLIAAITMASVTNIAICLGGTTSQDLKTGFMLGSTPRSQQLAEIVGLILPAAAIGGTLYLLHHTYGFGSREMPAPQATLMALIAKGVIAKELPVTLVMIGVALGVLLQFLGISVLAFAIGLYLPLSLSTSVMVGGIVHYLVKRFGTHKDRVHRGILAASGMVAGNACMGVVVALLAVLNVIPAAQAGKLNNMWSLFFFLAFAWAFGAVSNSTIFAKQQTPEK